VLDKLQRSLDAGQHYEAQQMLKTVYHRFRARKQLQEAYQLLQVRSKTSNWADSSNIFFWFTDGWSHKLGISRVCFYSKQFFLKISKK
jgi:hypothetical protein